MKELTLANMNCVVVETGPAPRHSVIWLHGLGADAHDFAPIVPQLTQTQRRPTRFVFPNAPRRPVTVNGGMVMQAWYDILGFDVARDQDLAGIEQSIQAVRSLIDHEYDIAGVDGVVLAGFSQGGAIALRAGLASPRPLLGIIALSTYLLQPDSIDLWASYQKEFGAEKGRHKPLVFMGHGTHDPVVPLSLGEAARQSLMDAGYSVDWYTWPMGHEVCLQEVEGLDRQLAHWMQAS